MRYLLLKCAILFYSYPLLQSLNYLAFLHSGNVLLRASLEVFFPSALWFPESAFPGLSLPSTSALEVSHLFSGFLLWSLSGLFHPVTLLGFTFRAFSFKRLSLLSKPLALLPLVVPRSGKHALCCPGWTQVYVSVSGPFPLKARSHKFGG